MKRFFARGAIVILAFLVMISMFGCTSKQSTSVEKETQKVSDSKESSKKVVMKITHGVGPDSVFHASAEKFKELVAKYSNGQVEVQIYPGGQIGSGERSVQDIQQGIIEATIESVNNMTPFAPTFGIFDMPYIVESNEEFYKVIDTLGEELNKKIIKESGLRPIIWFEQGPRVLGTKKTKVETINDLQGLKIRVPKNPIMLSAFNAWGVNATPIAWDETINAVQQGVVDGLELPYGDFYSTNLYETIKYITEIHYKYDIGAVIVKNSWLESQPEDIRNAIIKAAQETQNWQRGFTKEFINKAKKAMEEKQVVLCGPPKDEEVWIKKARAIWPQFYEKIGGKELVAKVMEVMGRQLP